MKKSLIFAMAAALFAMVSCQKELIIASDPVFNASIATTRTTVAPLTGKISWQEGDEVTVTDANNVSVIYVATNVNGGNATLTKKAGESGTLSKAPFSAVYGSVPSKNQTYSAQAPSLPMSAVSSDDTFNFSVTCGLLELSLTKAKESIKSIAVSDGTDTYTLTCDSAISIETGGTFYMALPASDYTTFTFTDFRDSVCVVEKTGAKITVSNNAIQPVSFATALKFPKVYPEGAMSGVFSVSDTKKVRFSKGNLQYQASNGGTWRFAEHQYDFIGANPGNTTATESRDNQADWIDLFGWGATGRTKSQVAPYESSTSQFAYHTGDANVESETLTRENGGDWGVCMGDDWRTLSNDEWEYLLKKRGIPYRVKNVKVTPDLSVYGLVIMPDGWTGSFPNTTTLEFGTWKSLESDDAVFLPMTGYRNGTEVINVSDDKTRGYYWTTNSFSIKNAYNLFINIGYDIKFPNNNDRNFGCSVRLVVDN